jgi:two-component system KDP operon response regulator KdpE
MTGMRIVLIENDRRFVTDIAFCIQMKYPEASFAATDRMKGLEMVEKEAPDLVMIDDSSPETYGVELIRQIREFSDVPIIMLSANETDLDRAKALEAGADSYTGSPFSPLELLARVKALLRRVNGGSFRNRKSLYVNEGLIIDFATREINLYGESVRLTPIEFHLFSELVGNTGTVVTYATLLAKIWGFDNVDADGDGFVKKYIYRIRSKLERGGHPQRIANERGVGYRFTAA